MKVFISYHRADSAYRRKAENILKSHNIDYYAVPEDKNFNGQSAEKIRTYLCGRLKQCDVLLCLIGKETFSRPHEDHEIHTALRGNVGERLGIVGVQIPKRTDTLLTIDLNTFPTKLWDNKDYVVWSEWTKLNDNILSLLNTAYERSINTKYQTVHSNPCMPLKQSLYYDN